MNAAADRRIILALFENKVDEEASRPLLAGLPRLLRFRSPPDWQHFTGTMASLQLNPSLVILSGRLYPGSRPELVTDLRNLYPDAEILLITLATDPLPPLQQLAADLVRHLLVIPAEAGAEEVPAQREAINRLLAKSPWKLAECMRPGTRIHEIPLYSSRQKETLIAVVENAVTGDSMEMELLRQRAALLVDEMIENALYGAPQGHDGKKLYRKGEARAIADAEKIVFRFAFDGETLAMEIADGWGTLAPELVVDFLSRNQDGLRLDDGEAGGRGLFIIWRFLDHMHVNILPGRQTVLGGYLSTPSAVDCEGPKGFSISYP